MIYYSTDRTCDWSMTLITIIVLKFPFVFIFFFLSTAELEGKLLDFVRRTLKNLYSTYKEK